MRVLFRVDAGAAVGLGHLHRCLALGAALRRLGSESVVLTSSEGPVREQVERAGFDHRDLATERLGDPADLGCTLAVARDGAFDAIVTDSYHMDEGYHRALRASSAATLAVDDFALHPFASDLVVNAAPYADARPYPSAHGGTRFLLGPRFAMLRPEFAEVAPRSPAREVRRLLVTFGAADTGGRTLDALEALASLGAPLAVTVVVGPLSAHRERVEAWAAKSGLACDVVVAPPTLRPLMDAADLAISAGGQTLYEMAATGLPAVAVVVAENQRQNVAALAAAGTVEPVLPRSGQRFGEPVARAVALLLRDPAARTRMSSAGQRLVDGRGATRVADALVAAASDARHVGPGHRATVGPQGW